MKGRRGAETRPTLYIAQVLQVRRQAMRNIFDNYLFIYLFIYYIYLA